jgi:cobalt/nickel transport protein
MRFSRLFLPALCLCLFGASPAKAHFGMVIPSESTVMDAGKAAITLNLKFWHPFENMGMNLDKPLSFQVFHNGTSTDLLPSLKESAERGLRAWTGSFSIDRPGLYAFAMEPKPYFEKEEDCFIIHYTNAYVDAFGDDEGWADPVGLKAEIVPLTRPGALYAGNVFQGRVLVDGKPRPGLDVEVEWYPGPGKKGVAPHAGMVTQTVRTDDAGIFSYAAPREGWWGFAALRTAEEKMPFAGADKDVEIGAVLWLRFYAMPAAENLKK